jgi:5-formaminoimidazole-4-carboxamide-1-(beta)-D-ribofuranosyl 5'-monophosphate synthetase
MFKDGRQHSWIMVTRERIRDILHDYDDIVLATVCSHSSLQIFHGAKEEGFRTLGIAIGERPKFYDAFPRARPDDFLIFDDYRDLARHAPELVERQVVAVPHGSFVEYMGPKAFADFEVPTFGNRGVLAWEADREKQREWLSSARVEMPRKIERPEDIDRPVFVKYHGAKGGRGFFIAKNYEEFREAIDPRQPYTIQEYVVGSRYYIHFFYRHLRQDGYRVRDGSLELLSIDRRDESNIDEMYKLGAQERLRKLGIVPTFVVTGNFPVVLRESLLPKAFAMGERVVDRSIDLFGGMIGPFCLETIVTDQLEFKVFEISTRIVAGTNLFVSGSPYSDLLEPNLSTGRRIAQEIRLALKKDRLAEILS